MTVTPKPKPKPTSRAPKRATPRTSKTRRPEPSHGEISERAYYLHLEGQPDELTNWLQAERELTAA